MITGSDYPTRDGTGIRDYIHVWDLARAHVRAVERFDQVVADVGATSVTMNVGTGDGVTVRELVSAFERVYGSKVRTVAGPARPGDSAGAFANVDQAAEVLGWRAQSSLETAIDTALRWGRQRRSVLGYD